MSVSGRSETQQQYDARNSSERNHSFCSFGSRQYMKMAFRNPRNAIFISLRKTGLADLWLCRVRRCRLGRVGDNRCGLWCMRSCDRDWLRRGLHGCCNRNFGCGAGCNGAGRMNNGCGAGRCWCGRMRNRASGCCPRFGPRRNGAVRTIAFCEMTFCVAARRGAGGCCGHCQSRSAEKRGGGEQAKTNHRKSPWRWMSRKQDRPMASRLDPSGSPQHGDEINVL